MLLLFLNFFFKENDLSGTEEKPNFLFYFVSFLMIKGADKKCSRASTQKNAAFNFDCHSILGIRSVRLTHVGYLNALFY